MGLLFIFKIKIIKKLIFTINYTHSFYKYKLTQKI